MALVLGIPMRRLLGLQDYITDAHLVNLAKVMLAAGLVVAYGYFAEIFSAFYSMDRYELAVTLRRMTGAYAWTFWGTIFCNVLSIQLLWFARVRSNHSALFVIALLALVGMWLERFMLIVTTLYQDFTPSSWGMYYPTLWDIAFLIGSMGLFLLMFLLFVRLLPVISMFELRKLVRKGEGNST
jgi:molybdopterin-containing oxidoreductase family membrane subunit